MYFMLGKIKLSLKGESFCPALYVISGLCCFLCRSMFRLPYWRRLLITMALNVTRPTKSSCCAAGRRRTPESVWKKGWKSMNVHSTSSGTQHFYLFVLTFASTSLRCVLIMSTLYLWSNLHFKQMRNSFWSVNLIVYSSTTTHSEMLNRTEEYRGVLLCIEMK